MIQLNDHIAVDINTGKPHFTLGWTRDDKNDIFHNGPSSQGLAGALVRHDLKHGKIRIRKRHEDIDDGPEIHAKSHTG